MKTYFRLLSFAKPIEKYAIPYIICTVITVIFGTLNLALLAPLLQVMFKGTGDADLGAVEIGEKPGLDDLGGLLTYYADKLYYDIGPYYNTYVLSS